MIIEKLLLREGMIENLDTFSEKRNLIYSKTNTKGKSTFVRLLFYALGYPIPNMRGIKYEDIITEITFSEKGQKYTATRENNLLTLFSENSRIEFTLPSQHMSFLSFVFKYENIKVLKNLLGFMYVDQDKGWTLLNRGTVIGKIKFSIEELLAGLNGIDIDDLIEKKTTLELNRDKYLAMLNIQELSEQVYEQNGEIFISDIEKELNEKIAYCNIKLENEKNALKEINSVLLKEKQFFDYIDSMNLSVKQDDVIIPVNRTIKSDGVINLFSDIKEEFSLFDPKFLEEVANMKEKNLAVELLKKLIAEQVSVYRRTNVVKSEKFSEIMQRSLNAYLNGMLTNEEVIEEMLNLAKQIAAAKKEGDKLGLTADELAFYDALTKPQAIKDFYENEELIAITKELADTLRRNKTIDWQKRESARAKMRMLIKKLLKKHKYPPEGMEDAVQTVMTQCELWTDNNDMGEENVINFHRKSTSYAELNYAPMMVAESTATYGEKK